VPTHLLTTQVDVLRQSRTLVNGIMQISWATALYTNMPARVDLLWRDTRTQVMMTAESGKTPDRQGILFYPEGYDLLAGDRVRCVAGPASGLFELDGQPELAIGLTGSHYEAFIREVTTS
jgi:hypothetical protein